MSKVRFTHAVPGRKHCHDRQGFLIEGFDVLWGAIWPIVRSVGSDEYSVFITVSLLVGDIDCEREPQFSFASLVHGILRPIDRCLRFLSHLLDASNDPENDRRGPAESLDTDGVIEATVTEEFNDIEWKYPNAVEQLLDHVTLRFVVLNSGNGDEEWLRPAEDESSEVVVELEDDIAENGVAEFTG